MRVRTQQRIMGVGGTYDFGWFNVLGNYTNVLFNYSDSTGLRLQNLEGAAYKYITPAWEMGVAYVYTHGDYSIPPSAAKLIVDVVLRTPFDASPEGQYRRTAAQSGKIRAETTYDNRFVERAMSEIQRS